jgi:uncharacterized membrane protein YbhN (UPF0104 family)
LSIAGGISLFSLFIAVSVSEVGKLKGAFWPVAPAFLLWTALALAASYGLRAWRLAIVMNVPWSPGITQVALLHNLLNALLPAKLGELSLPLLIRRYQGDGLAKGLGVLVVVRVLDVLGLLGWCSALLLVQNPLGEGSGRLPGLAGLGATVGLLAVLIGMGRYFRRQPPASASSGRWPKIRRLWQDLGAGLAGLSSTRLGYAVLLSVLIWILIAAAFHTAALAFGITAPFVMTTLATASATLAFMLPINGLASLGPPQLAWAGVLTALGGGWERSLVAATATQLVALAVMGLLVANLAAFMAWPVRKTEGKGWS